MKILIENLKNGDVVKYRRFFMKKQGKITAISSDKSTCVIHGQLVKTSCIYKILH